MWAVMKAMAFDALDSDHIKMVIPQEGIGQPQRFIPVFNLREDAVKFLGDEKGV